jgi:hypothetical protein
VRSTPAVAPPRSNAPPDVPPPLPSPLFGESGAATSASAGDGSGLAGAGVERAGSG